jgi:insertion element IS1 protein InsB
MIKMPTCPRCGSSHVIKNGHIHNGKPKFGWKDRRRQFVENPTWRPIGAETKALIDKLLLERTSMAGTMGVTGVSALWLQDYVNAKYAAQRQVTDIPAPKNGG